MKVRLKIVLPLCLLALVAVFWWRAGRETPAPTAAVTSTGAVSGATSTTSAAPAPEVITRSAASTNRLAYRLANTAKPLSQLVADKNAILLENAFIDTAAGLGALQIPAHLKAEAEPGAFIVQARGVIDPAFRTAIGAAGGQVVSYIPNNALLVTISAAGAASLRGQTRVQAVLPYEPYYKVQSTLLGAAVQQKKLPAGTYLTLGLFGPARAETIAELERLGAQVMASDRTPFGELVRVRPPENWVRLAKLPGVQLIEPVYRRQIANDLSRPAVGTAANATTSTNYLGLTGSNVLVQVNDTGIDPTHPDFAATTNGGPSRVSGDFANSLLDTDGHGTHVAGIIAGNGAMSGTVIGARGSATNANFRGKAPNARLFSVGGIAGGNLTNFAIGDSYLQEAPALTNALISNNSWEYAGNYQYDLAAASYDAAVRDALPERTGPQPVLFVFAAGNEGGGDNAGGSGTADSITSPGTAKNVITVGALEQLRNITNIVTALDGSSNAIWAAETDSSFQVARYSSRGNVGIQSEGEFGRFKPDVVAPGTFVISTTSTNWDQQAYYNITNYYGLRYTTFAETNSLVYGSITVPQNAVSVSLRIVQNSSSATPFPTNFPIYISATGYPDPTDAGTYDFVKIGNRVDIPADGGPGYINGLLNAGVFYTIGTPGGTVIFDVIEQIATTNDLGNELLVRSNLNSTLAPYYRFESGTSMATPAVSGVLACMQDFFTNRLQYTPSPALMKAMLINGARVTGSYRFAVTNTINYQGWGLVKLSNSIPAQLTNIATAGTNGVPMFFVDQSPTNTLATGDRRTYDVSLNSAAARALPLRVTLAWTDPPGNPAAAIKLVNSLDLVITNKSNGQVFSANSFTSSGSPPFTPSGGTNVSSDYVNNVQNIFLSPTLGTNYSVTVVGRAVNVNAVTLEQTNIVQDFALVISSGDGNNTNGIVVTPATPSLASAITPRIDYLPGTNGIYFNQIAGSSAPLLNTNDSVLGSSYGFYTNSAFHIGQTNQWKFYAVTNTLAITNSAFTNAAFIVFLPRTAAIPREGVFADSNGNSTRPEADIELLVASAPLADAGQITNLSYSVISNCLAGANGCGASIGRGGTEFVVFSNSVANQVYYVGVQCQDQMGSQFAFVPVFSDQPFSTTDSNGNTYVRGLLAPVNIADGNNANPGKAYVIGLSLATSEVNRVIVTNTYTHQNFGDLFGALSHENHYAVLNNHVGLGTVDNSQLFIYDDSGRNDLPGSQRTDGPGSLTDFRGDKSAGVWLLTQIDNSFTQTGRVDSFNLKIEPHRNLRNQPFQIVVVPAGGWYYDYIDVPVGYTNLLLVGTNVSLLPNPPPNQIQMYLNTPDVPGLSNYLARADLTNGTPPGNSISYGPPLNPGRYFVGLYNPGGTDQSVLLGAILTFDASSILTVNHTSDGPLAILDDAVTRDSIFVTDSNIVQNFSVGLRVDHERVSDLTFHLVAPDGTRYLLAENRGGQTTNGFGSTTYVTKIVNATASGNARADTNVINTGLLFGTFPITYNFYTAPDQMTVYYGTNEDPRYLIYDTGMTNNLPLGPGPQNTQPVTIYVSFPPAGVSADSPYLTIVMNQYGNTNRITQWTYTAGGVLTNYNYLTFTENTNLTTTPIKFAVPPYLPQSYTLTTLQTNIAYTTNFTYVTNITYVTNVTFAATNIALSGFEASTVTAYTTAQTVDGWTVISNQVSVVSDSSNSLAGTRFLTLANGSLSRNLSTPVGTTNTVSFISRGPGIVSWWRGETNVNDSVSGYGANLMNGASYGAGQVGGGFTYDSLNDFVLVQVPTNSALDVGKGKRFTIEGWIYPTNLTVNRPVTQFERVLAPSSGSDVACDFFVSLSGASGRMYANIGDTAGVAHSFSSPIGTVTLNTWQHVALTYDGGSGTGAMYRNGILVASSFLGFFTPQTSFTNFLIGARTYTGSVASPADRFAGTIDELSVYKRALSISELKAIFNAGNKGKFDPTGLVPQNLAQVTLSIPGQTVLYGGNNNTWQTNTFTFVASSNTTVLRMNGIQPGMLIDAVTLAGYAPVTNIIATATNVVIVTNFFSYTNGYTQWPTNLGGNGHWYKAVAISPITWNQASNIATASGGYLATITSSNENVFVFGLINSSSFFQGVGFNGAGPAIGGMQPDGNIEPGQGWIWVTGEPWIYDAWGPGLDNGGCPTGSNCENRAHYWSGSQGVPANTWNDLPATDSNLGGYIIEKDFIPTGNPITTNVTVATNLTLVSSNQVFLPEHDMSSILGRSPYGEWQLEILDNRTGGGLTNSLVSWTMQFQYANTNVIPNPVLPTLATNYSVIESNLFTLTNTATYSVSNATLIYSLSGPPGAAISTNGIITWTPAEDQAPYSYIFITTVYDSANPTRVAQNFFQLDTLESNLPPVITFPTTNTVIRIVETESFTTNATATDPDIPTNTLSFAFVGSQNVSGSASVTGLTVAADGTISWLPSETNGPSTNIIFISVTDTNPPAVNQKSFTVTNNFTLVVLESNLPPVLFLPPNTNILEMVLWSARATATDPDFPTNALTFGLVSGPSGLNVAPDGVISWTPSESQGPGTYFVTVSVTDTNPWAAGVNQTSFTVTDTFSITVDEVNRAPIWTNPYPTVVMDELTVTNVSGLAFDPDIPTNNIFYSLSGAPSWVSINPTSAVVTFNPDELIGPSTNTITVLATDDGLPPLSTPTTFTVIVNEVNTAPFWSTNPPPQTNYATIANVIFTATNAASDADVPANTLSYALINSPAGATINSNGVITWIPTPSQAGRNFITTVVTDFNPWAIVNQNLSATNVIMVFVTYVPGAAPYAYTEPATLQNGSSAQLNGFATANGADTAAWFEFGTSLSYGVTTPAINIGTNYSVTFVTNQMTGLLTNVPYHYRLVVSNALGIAYGFDQIFNQGNVVAWGANGAGQSTVPSVLTNLSIGVACGSEFSLVLNSDASVYAWGNGSQGQTNVPVSLTNAVAISGGREHSAALRSNRRALVWGSTIFGKTNVPPSVTNAVFIAAGDSHTLAIRADGNLFAWGANFAGQSSIPAGLSNVVSVAGGIYHSVALKNDSTVVAFGDNSLDQTNVPAGLTNVVAIAAGGYHNLALKNDGTVVAWGFNSAFQTNVPPGLTNVVAVAAGDYHSLALLRDGSVVGWGDNTSAQLLQPPGLTNVFAISAGGLHSLALSSIVGLNQTNNAPFWTNNLAGTNITMDELTVLNVNNRANDTNFPAQILLYSLINSPSWASINLSSGLITLAPLEVDGPSTNTITTVVVDNGFPRKSATNTFTIIVRETNSPPFWTNSFPVVTMDELTTNLVNAAALDSDVPTNSVSYALTNSPAWASIDPISGLVTLIPGETNGPSTNVITIVATDNGVPPLSATTNFTVIVREVNTAPFWTNSFPLVTMDESTIGFVNAAAFDSDVPANTLSYSLITSPPWASINLSSGLITLAPGETNGSSTNIITFVVTDNGIPALSATNTFTIIVRETNSPPFWTNSFPVVTMDELTTNLVNAAALDSDVPTNSVSYALTNSPAWASIDPISGLVTLIPGETNGPSTNVITIVATDNGVPPLSATTNFTVIVREVNTAPFWTTNFPGQTNFIIGIGTSLTVTNTASDSDMPTNALSYKLTVSPAVLGAVIDSQGIITWTPTASGIFTFTTVVTDTNPYALLNNSLSATNAFTVTVTNGAVASNIIVIASIVQTNWNGTNGFLLTWFAPTNTYFQVQWSPLLSPATWNTFTNPLKVGYNLFISPTNSQFQFFDDGSQTGGFDPTRFYRLLQLTNNSAPIFAPQAVRYVTPGSLLNITNAATDAEAPPQILTYALVSPPVGVSIDTNTGVISWTPGLGLAGTTNTITTIVSDNGSPVLSATNTISVIVFPLPVLGSVNVVTNGVALQWSGWTNEQFQVRWSTNLLPPVAWTLFPQVVTSSNGVFDFTDTNAPLVMKFYQLILLP